MPALDIAHTPRTTASLTVDGAHGVSSIDRDRDHATDRDWWRVLLTANTPYAIHLTRQNSALDPLVRLLDRSGNEVGSDNDSGGIRNAQLFYTPRRTGTYFVEAASHADFSTGAYAVWVTNEDPGPDIANHGNTTAVLSPGGPPGTSRIDRLRDQDFWSISLAVGTGYTFRLTGSANGDLDPYLRLLDSTGRELAHDDNSGGDTTALLHYTPTQTGTYFLSAEAFDRLSTGDYTLEAMGVSVATDIRQDTDTAANLSVNGLAGSSRVEIIRDEDWWRVSLSAGTPYAFRLNSTAGTSLDPYLHLLNSSGVGLASDDNSGDGNNALLVFTPATTGTYFLSAQAHGGDSLGAYTLSASSDISSVATTSDSRSLATNRRLDADDHQVFTVPLVAGNTYRFTLAGETTPWDGVLSLTDEADHLLAFMDDSRTDETLVWTATETGNYQLTVAAGIHQAGSYDLTMETMAAGDATYFPDLPTRATSLRVGSTAHGTIDTGNEDLWYAVNLIHDTPYSFTLTPDADSDLDLVLRLVQNGEELVYADNSHTREVIAFTPTVDGTYYLATSAWTNRQGSFDLAVRQVQAFTENGTLPARVPEGIVTGRHGLDLTGNTEDNSLFGNSGNNTLDGRAGDDLMAGGAGHDRYLCDSLNDLVIENANNGTDTVVAAVSFDRLFNQVENLTLMPGHRNLDGMGHGGDNTLTGNDGNNQLNGGAGMDVLYGEGGNDTLIGGVDDDQLTGGDGADTFRFESLTRIGTDIITDFANQDRLVFLDTSFGRLEAGPLASDRFVANPAGRATSGRQRFIFNTASRLLSFDSNGSGQGGVTPIATLNTRTLTHDHLHIVTS